MSGGATMVALLSTWPVLNPSLDSPSRDVISRTRLGESSDEGWTRLGELSDEGWTRLGESSDELSKAHVGYGNGQGCRMM